MNLKEMSTSVLMHLENDIRRELSYRKYHEGYKQGQFDASMDSVAKITTVSPQQKRDAIVEQAKKDVAELVGDFHAGKKYRVDVFMCNVEFVVNPEKRTVVALMVRREYLKSTVICAKGIAKCAPSDCFNAHIGRAISLRRALGLEVPSEYLSPPQPTEVRVGDVVANFGNNGWVNEPYRVDYIDNGDAHERASGWIPVDLLTILDDTREGVDAK